MTCNCNGGSCNCGKFTKAANYKVEGGKRMISEAIGKAKGSSRTPFGKRRGPKGKA